MNNSQFKQAILQIGRFTDEQLALIIDAATHRLIDTGEVLLQEGNVCQSCFFLEKGTITQFALNEDSGMDIIDLHITGDWVMNVQSFTQQRPSQYRIQSQSECEIYELDIHRIHQLIEGHPAMFQLGRILGEATSRLEFWDRKRNPQEKYEFLPFFGHSCVALRSAGRLLQHDRGSQRWHVGGRLLLRRLHQFLHTAKRPNLTTAPYGSQL
ncbi:MAG: Crp/Fnr family transcriptional regulator [Bacteroidota bacterium]